MKKRLWISVLFFIVMIGGVYFILKFNPPLEIGTLGTSNNNNSVVIGVGNKGFREVKILDVRVNNNEKASETKVQHSNALQGFIITDDYNNEDAKKYGFTNLEDVPIKVGTSPSSNFKKLDNGAASESDDIYGISVTNNEAINKVHIRYSFLGFSFNETVLFN